MTVSDIQYKKITADETGTKRHRKRKEVFGGSVVDVILGCSADDFNTVYNGWKELIKEPRKLGIETFQNFFEQYPDYERVFSTQTDDEKKEEPRDDEE